MAHLYEVGTKAWQPDPTEGWVASELVSKTSEGDKFKLVFNLENGEVRLLSPHGCPVRAFSIADANIQSWRPDQDHRDDLRGPRVGQQPRSPSFNEPSDARSQR